MPDTDTRPVFCLAAADIRLVDVAEPYADLTDDVHIAAFGRPYDGPDWRWELKLASGVEATMHAGATADDVALYLNAEHERQVARNA